MKTYEQEKQARKAIYLILNPKVKLDMPVFKLDKDQLRRNGKR